MICFKCEKKIDFVEQMTEWEEMCGDDAMLGPEHPILIMLHCPTCEEQRGMMDIIGLTEDDFDVVKVDGKKLKIPKRPEYDSL